MKRIKMREGLIARGFHSFSSFVHRAVTAGFLGRLFTSFSRSETLFHTSRVGHALEEGRGGGHVHRTVRRNVAVALSENPLFRGIKSLLLRLCASGLRSIGLFFFVAGGYSSIVFWLSDKVWNNNAVTGANLVVGIAAMLLGILMLFSDVSLGFAIRKSFFCHGILSLFCLTDEPLHDIARRGKNDYVLAVPLGMAVGSLSALVSPLWMLFSLFALLLILLVFAVPEAGVFFAILFLPFAGFLPHAVVWVAISVLLPLMAYIGKLLCGKRALHFGMQDLPLLCLLLCFLLSGFSLSGSGAWQGALLSVLFLLAYFLVANAISTREWALRCHIGVILAASVAAVVGTVQFILAAIAEPSGPVSAIGTAVHAGFSDHIAFGYFLMLAFPFALALLLECKRQYRFLCGVACLILFGAAVLTFETVAWVAQLITSLVFLLVLVPRSFPYVFLGTGLGAMASVVLPDVWRRDLRFFLQGPYATGRAAFSATMRRVFFTKGQGIYSSFSGFKRLLFGLGYGGIETLYPAFAAGGTVFVRENCNFWLYLLAEYGILGILLPAVFFFLLLQNCFSMLVRRTEDYKPSMTVAGIALVVVVIFYGFFHYTWYDPAAMTAFFAMAGLIAAMLRREATVRSRAAGQEDMQSGSYAELEYSMHGGDSV